MKLAPARIDGMQAMVAADEIQLWQSYPRKIHTWGSGGSRHQDAPLPVECLQRERLAPCSGIELVASRDVSILSDLYGGASFPRCWENVPSTVPQLSGPSPV